MSKVIAVSTNKGGVLKTSITTNLAGLLAIEGNKVLIIDSDNQGNVSITFNRNPDDFNKTLYDVLLDEVKAEDVIFNVYKNIDILPSNDDLSFFEMDVFSNLKQYDNVLYLFKNKLDHLKEKYDYILIDTPPNLGLLVGNVFNYADEVIIPFQPEAYSMRSLIKTVQQIQSFQRKHNPNLKIKGIVGTLIDSRTYIHSEILSECRKFGLQNDIKVFDTVIPRSIRFANSVSFEGLPSTLSEKGKNLLSNAYVELKEEMTNG
uniref:ParA family protein n=1 Tax=uncultured Allobacillus sp. TaxID=1638025 RepID=UPI00259742D3|nr:ParA family protein [uncultured Allobacillus sp.]